MEAMMAEHKGRAYIAKEKSWGDTNFDEEPVQSNYACAHHGRHDKGNSISGIS